MSAIEDMKWEVMMYQTNKILQGHGLQDDPEWVEKFENIIDNYERT